jgi:hypothetical protein
MSKHVARKATLALTLMLAAVMSGRASAQPLDCATDHTSAVCVVGGTNPEPQVVGGTNPEPQVVSGASSSSDIVFGDLALLDAVQMT